MRLLLCGAGAGVDGQLERVRRCLGCYSGGYCRSFSIDKGDKSGDIVLTKIQVRHSGPVPDAGGIRKKLYEVIVKELPASQLWAHPLWYPIGDSGPPRSNVFWRHEGSVDVAGDASLLEKVSLSPRL